MFNPFRWSGNNFFMQNIFTYITSTLGKERSLKCISYFANFCYFLWLDRSRTIFHRTKPQNAITIHKQALSSTYSSTHADPISSPSGIWLEKDKNASLILVDGSFSVENNCHASSVVVLLVGDKTSVCIRALRRK